MLSFDHDLVISLITLNGPLFFFFFWGLVIFKFTGHYSAKNRNQKVRQEGIASRLANSTKTYAMRDFV